MTLRYDHLDKPTRTFMLDELHRDLAARRVSFGSWLANGTREQLGALLLVIFAQATDANLADVLRSPGALEVYERDERGAQTKTRVPRNGHVVLADVIFNHYYMRGLCRRAIDEDVGRLEIFRARGVRVPRATSRAKEGKLVSPRELLEDLRDRAGNVARGEGIIGAPGSSLSLRYPA